MGNVPVIVPGKVDVQPRPTSPVLASLDGKFDLKTYLSPYSDVVALMVLEHQTHMTNLLTRVGWEARLAAAERGNPTRPRGCGGGRRPDYPLFVDEAPFAGSIRGSSGFAEKFSAGPARQQGPVAAPAGSRSAADEVPVQLHDLHACVRRPAARRPERRLSTDVAGVVRPRYQQEVLDALARRPAGGCRDPARDKEGPA
jgi:hypothetical protein